MHRTRSRPAFAAGLFPTATHAQQHSNQAPTFRRQLGLRCHLERVVRMWGGEVALDDAGVLLGRRLAAVLLLLRELLVRVRTVAAVCQTATVDAGAAAAATGAVLSLPRRCHSL